jgi:Rod binding domain-containing protein
MDAWIAAPSSGLVARESWSHTSCIQPGDAGPEAGMREACADFEALFVAAMMTAMRGSAPRDGLLRVSRAEAVFREQLDYELARGMARRSSIGIAKMLYEQLSPASHAHKGHEQG